MMNTAQMRTRRLALAGWLVAIVLVFAPPDRAAVRLAAEQRSAPERIISLVPAVTEMLFAIGAGSRVVGVSTYDRFPPEVETRPKVGALLDPDFERILTLRPDLVVVYGSQTDLMARLARASLPYFSYRHAGLNGVMLTIRELGTRIGQSSVAERVATSIERDLADVRAQVAGRPRPRTVLVFGREPGALRGMYASGGVGFLHDLLETAGGEDVFADVQRESVQISTEVLLARAPEVILEVRSSETWSAARFAEERSLWKALPALPAVRRDRIYILADSSIAIPGPRVALAARRFADALHGDR